MLFWVSSFEAQSVNELSCVRRPYFKWGKGTISRCGDKKGGDNGYEFLDFTVVCSNNSYLGCWIKGGNTSFLFLKQSVHP